MSRQPPGELGAVGAAPTFRCKHLLLLGLSQPLGTAPVTPELTAWKERQTGKQQ